MRLIGITGMKDSGKTTVALILAKELGFNYTLSESALPLDFDKEAEFVVDNIATEQQASFIRKSGGVLIHIFRDDKGYNGEGPVLRKNQDYLIMNQDLSLEQLKYVCRHDVVSDIKQKLEHKRAWGLEDTPPPILSLDSKHSVMVTNLVKPGEDILKTLSGDTCNVIHMTMGISGEAGELLDAIKKYTMYNKPLDFENVVEELGDLEFYMEGLRQALKITREETLAANIAKLGKRYKAGSYSNEAAIAREDKQEETPFKLMTPTHYTSEEGGLWLEWRGGELNMTDLIKGYKTIAVSFDSLHNVGIHSLKFDKGEEWDCINGWRNV